MSRKLILKARIENAQKAEIFMAKRGQNEQALWWAWTAHKLQSELADLESKQRHAA